VTAGRLWALTALVVGLLIASLMFAFVRLGWHMGGHTSVLPLSTAVQPVVENAAPERDITAIIALAPFGQIAATQQVPQIRDAIAKIDLALRGVLVDPDPAQSRAYILAGGATSVFRIGDDVQSAELVAINADTITLMLGDQLQIVGFDGFLGRGTPLDQPKPSQQASLSDPFARLAAAIVPGRGSIDLRDGPPPETTDDYINLWRDKIAQNPKAAMDSVGVELVENGYRIKADPNIGVALAGLRPGDVVTRLNGQAVGDLDRDRQLYDDVAAAGIARLEVVRDGQALLLTFPLR
jgi:general secretion pathway protein C